MKRVGVALQIMGWVTFGIGVFVGLFMILLSDQLGLGLVALAGGVVGGTALFGTGSAIIALTHIEQAMERTAEVHEQTKARLEYFAQQAAEVNERSTIILEYLARTVKANGKSNPQSHWERTAPDSSTGLNHAQSDFEESQH